MLVRCGKKLNANIKQIISKESKDRYVMDEFKLDNWSKEKFKYY